MGGREIAVSPNGNVRDGDAFAILQGEIDKLTDIHGASCVDWSIVATRCESVLQDEGQDLAVAVWFAVARLQLSGPDGLAEGVRVLRDVITLSWDTMTPPPARLRGRRNLITWFLDRVEDALPGDRLSILPSLPAAALAGLTDDWNAIDAFWQEHDAQAPSFHRLQRVLTRLTAEADTSVALPSASDSAVPVPEDDTAAAGSTTLAMPATPALVLMPDTADADQLERAAAEVLRGLGPLLDICFTRQPTIAFAYRLNCIVAWSLLNTAPVASAGETRIPPPPTTELDALSRLAASADPLALARFAQTRLSTFPYWLDLCRHTHAALRRAGVPAAAAVVAAEAAALDTRLPGVLALQFDGGMPFADAATVEWFAAIRTPAEGAERSAPGMDEGAASLSAARGLAAEGRLGDALGALETLSRSAVAAGEQFRLRLEQCELVRDFGDASVLGPLVASLVKQIEIHQLARWEPALARRALSIAAGVRQEPDRSAQGLSLAKLAELDFAAAWRLAGVQKQ